MTGTLEGSKVINIVDSKVSKEENSQLLPAKAGRLVTAYKADF